MFQLCIFIKFEVSGNLPIYNPKPILAGINSYAKFEENRLKLLKLESGNEQNAILNLNQGP